MYDKKNMVILACVFLALAAGCREIKTSTTVHEDGRIDRTIAINGEAENLHESAFPLPVDSTWSVKRSKKNETDNKVITTYSRQFARISDLQARYEPDPGRVHQVRVDVQVKKKFRWFYTYWEYRETYHAYNTHHTIPVSDYLKADEFQQWIAEPDSAKDLDTIMDKWLMDNLFGEFYQTLEREIKRLQDPRLDPLLLEARKSALYHALMDSSAEADEVDEILAVCQTIFGSDALDAARLPIDSTLKALEAKVEFETDVSRNTFINSVTLPGRLWASNGQIQEQAQVSWQLSARHFQFGDFSMWAQSRKANPVLTTLSALLTLILLGGLCYSRLRRDRA